MLKESEKYEEETGKPSPVELSTKTSEWIPLEKEEKSEEEVAEEIDFEREKKIETFKDINCIDEETAVLLYNAGYSSIDALSIATVKDLSKIKGIKKKKAKEILKEIEEKFAKVESIDLGETAKKEIAEEETKLEEEVVSKDVKIEAFSQMNSIDDETSVLLYNAGYTSIDFLKLVTVKDLRKIKGIKKKKAKEILKEIEEESEWEKASEIELIESDEEPIVDESLEEKEDLEKQEKMQIFDDFSSIDEETAILLYNNGYTTIESLKDLTIKTLKDIGVKKRKAKKILKEIEEELVIPIEEETFEENESEQIDEKIDEYEEPIIEELEFFEEEVDIPEIKAEEIKDAFEGINSIDDKISNLLLKNGITTIQDLNDMTIKELTKIKGIRKKIAKKIKKEVNEYFEKISECAEKQMEYEEKPFISDEDFEEEEWESIPEEESVEGPVFMHKDYTLYEKEIVSKSGNKRVIRFFSKGEPEGAKKITLPKGYKVRKNKKTGVPYLKKKK